MRYILASLIALTLAACSSNPTAPIADAVSVSSTVADLKYQLEAGEVIETLDNAEITDFEVTVVIEALDQLDRSKFRLKDLANDQERLVLRINDVAFEYAKIRSAYLSVRQVALDNRGEYTDAEWLNFQRFDTTAKELDEQFQQLLHSVNANSALGTAVKMADAAARLATLF